MDTKNTKDKQVLSGYWYRVATFESCCDCGLCHEKEYKVIIKGKRARVYFRTWRDKKRTEKNRLKKQKCIEILTRSRNSLE